MNVTCPSCEPVYRVDPAKVPAGGVRARCAVCSNVFAVGNAAETSATAPRAVMAASAPAGAAVTPPAAAPVFTPATTAPRTPPAPPPPPAAPPGPPPARRPTPAPPATPPRPPVAPPVGAPVRPLAAPPVSAPVPRAAPPASPVVAPAAPPRPAPAPAPSAPAAAPRAAAPPVAPAAGGPPLQRKTGPLRAVNPFLVQDPKQKARRLARALISDMIVYHPEKRQQGIRDGTLPQLFKDEIEKSWLEYVDQVGAELAQSTPVWSEALTEILAGGGKVF